MNTRDLEAFLAVVETGSIVAAAVRLNLTQPGVTRRVQNLEQTLGIALLDRQSKPLKPTKAGRDAYEQARVLVRALEDLKTRVSPDGRVSGEFRLGVTPYLSEMALPGIDRLRAGYPELTLKIASDWSPNLIRSVTSGEIDAAGIYLPEGIEPPDELVSDDLGAQQAIVIAARDLPFPDRPGLRDLARANWVMNQDGCGFRSVIRRRLEAEGLPFRVCVEAVSTELRFSLIARGLGLGIATAGSLARYPLRESLRAIALPELNLKVRIWMVHRPPAGRLAGPIGAFRDALAEELARES